MGKKQKMDKLVDLITLRVNITIITFGTSLSVTASSALILRCGLSGWLYIVHAQES